MNAEQRELFRRALLLVLDANGTERGLGTTALGHLIGPFYPAKASAEELRAELQYLADKGLVATANKAISPENTAWRITAAGRDLVAQS